jgi:predicted RNA binding protein YcfA (HicA-like mRNA interferase family)
MPKVRDVIQRLESEGWVLRRARGDHRQYYHPEHPELRVTIAGRRNDDLPPGTWNSIQKQAGWKQETVD